MGPAPDVPAMSFVQNVSVSLPSGEMTPIPVMNTLPVSRTGSDAPRDMAQACVRGRRPAGTRRATGDDAGHGTSGRRGRVRLQVVHRVADGLELVGFLVGDLEAELLLERHHQLDDVERIRAE